MPGFLSRLFNDDRADLRAKIVGLYALLIAANILAWLWAFALFRDRPLLLGTALLAYGFGLRHAVDADHIAAIDNVTRKLMQEGKRPVAAGFFFALGHSAVIVAMSVGVAFAAAALEEHFADLKAVGGVVSTAVSAFFLFAVAAVNIVILAAVWRSFQAAKRGGRLAEAELDLLLNGRGFLARLFRPLFRLVGRSWHLLPIGLLFGLGFDTATEIALFGISGAEAAKGASLATILVFTALFTAGMSLVDTTDGVLMLGAYGWAFRKPLRKLYYNLTITIVSVTVAFLIGGIEVLGLVADQLKLEGAFWDGIGALDDNFATLGYLIIGLFAASWLVSLAIYRLKGYDALDAELR